MPRGDKTGPNGKGAMTGRGMGYCSGNDSPGFFNPGFNQQSQNGLNGRFGMGRRIRGKTLSRVQMGPGRGGQGGGKGRGQGRGGGRGIGPGGECRCPSCGETVAHQQGTPCFEIKCPKCGATMTRK